MKNRFAYIRFEITGNKYERFINLCKNRNIIIYNIKLEDNKVTADMTAKDVFKIKEIIRMLRCHFRIISKNGRYFTLLRYRNRAFFILGIIILFAVIYLYAIRIWQINIEGNLYYSDETINRFLEEKGIRKGIIKSHISCETLEKAIREEFDRISFVSVEQKNCRLNIDISELNKVEYLDKTSMKDIVATKPGIIKSILTRTGTPLVKAGDEVKQGDILVTSKVESMDESMQLHATHYFEADSDILIETIQKYDEKILRKYSKKIYTGRKMVKTSTSVSSLIFGYKLNNSRFEHYDVFVEKYEKSGIINYIITFREYVYEDAFYTDGELRQMLEQKLKKYSEKLAENSVQIVSDSVTIKIDKNMGKAVGDIVLLENATAKVPPAIVKEN